MAPSQHRVKKPTSFFDRVRKPDPETALRDQLTKVLRDAVLIDWIGNEAAHQTRLWRRRWRALQRIRETLFEELRLGLDALAPTLHPKPADEIDWSEEPREVRQRIREICQKQADLEPEVDESGTTLNHGERFCRHLRRITPDTPALDASNPTPHTEPDQTQPNQSEPTPADANSIDSVQPALSQLGVPDMLKEALDFQTDPSVGLDEDELALVGLGPKKR